jgi:GR25 family glycosyltransferase involved in LPS biosynthesis
MTPQLIAGSRSAGSQPALITELAKAGIQHVIIQPGYYETKNVQTNISRAHKRCVAHAKSQNWPFCVILEDDVTFTHPDSYRYFIESMDKLPRDWDVYTSAFYTTNKFERDYENIYRVEGFAGLHCYAVNSKFYDTFLQADEKENIDWWISQAGRSYCFACYPFAAEQKAGYSENVKQHRDYSYLLQGKERFAGFRN